MDTKRKVFVVLGSVAVIATAGFTAGALFLGGSDENTNTGSSNISAASGSTTTDQPTSSADAGSQSDYKDGTYTASASYRVPHGYSNSIQTTITVKDGTVTSVKVNNDATDRESSEYIDWFEQDLEGEVVGKSLAGLSPSRIGGASLTTAAFDDTLDTIERDATA